MKLKKFYKSYFGLAVFFVLIPFTFLVRGNEVEFLILENNFDLLFVFLVASFILAVLGFDEMKKSQKTNSNF